MDVFQFIPGYETAIFENGREPAFFMLVSFLVTYLIARGYTSIARVRGWGSANLGGVHAHHMVFGVIIAFLSGSLIISLLPEQGFLLLLLSAAFGCGAALVLDEFALVFHLQDVYWKKEGRKSVDAVVLAAAFGGLFLIRVSPFGANTDEPTWILTSTVLINILFSIIAALKGKIFLAIFGIFLPTISMIGSIRLAEPNSIWARKFYKNKPKKVNNSIQRYKDYEKTWRPRKEKAWDLVGGKLITPKK